MGELDFVVRSLRPDITEIDSFHRLVRFKVIPNNLGVNFLRDSVVHPILLLLLGLLTQLLLAFGAQDGRIELHRKLLFVVGQAFLDAFESVRAHLEIITHVVLIYYRFNIFVEDLCAVFGRIIELFQVFLN